MENQIYLAILLSIAISAFSFLKLSRYRKTFLYENFLFDEYGLRFPKKVLRRFQVGIAAILEISPDSDRGAEWNIRYLQDGKIRHYLLRSRGAGETIRRIREKLKRKKPDAEAPVATSSVRDK